MLIIPLKIIMKHSYCLEGFIFPRGKKRLRGWFKRPLGSQRRCEFLAFKFNDSHCLEINWTRAGFSPKVNSIQPSDTWLPTGCERFSIITIKKWKVVSANHEVFMYYVCGSRVIHNLSQDSQKSSGGARFVNNSFIRDLWIIMFEYLHYFNLISNRSKMHFSI